MINRIGLPFRGGWFQGHLNSDDDLDHILLDQYHSAKRRLRLIRNIKKLLPKDPVVVVGEEYILKKVEFFESMISDKSLLNKKKSKVKKECVDDVLYRNPIYTWYRNAYMVTFMSYKMVYDYMQDYFPYGKKDK